VVQLGVGAGPADAIVYSANFLYARASHLAQVLIILVVAIAVL
jgi:hypothetical protein